MSGREGSLRVLVVGTDDWAVDQAVDSLAAAGHSTLRCHDPGERPFPCNALREGRTCPLETGFDVVATVRARVLAEPGPQELGVVCGLRAGAPLVVAGLAHRNPFAAWTDRIVDGAGDLVSACEEVAQIGVTQIGVTQIGLTEPAAEVIDLRS